MRLVRYFMLACLSALAQASAQRPNVVLIIADDQAWTDFGFMGHHVVATPSLDRLAAESAVFARGYVPTSMCRPSLATILTGRYPHEHGITGNDPPKGTPRAAMLKHIDRATTVPALLAAAGYRCLQTGKWWEGNFARGGFTDGMTHGDPARGGRHGDDGLRIGRQGLDPIFDFVDDCGEQPFFVWYAPFLPHRPHDPPQRLRQKYATAGRSPHVARYLAMCEWFDETCGALLGGLDKRGLRDNTIVLFLVDNGWIQRPDAPGYAPRSKRSPYDCGIRTPILVRWPRRVEPGRRETVVHSIDLAPTILAACGVDTPDALPGVDLVPVSAGREPDRVGVVGATFTHDVADLDNPSRSLRHRWIVSDQHKLIMPASGASAELYDIVADPREHDDRAAREPDRVASLAAELDRWWTPKPATRRPNVLLVVTDDQRADALGVAGHPFLETPNMDELARQGVRFTNAFVTTSICAASRATILTGRYRGTHGYTFGTPPLASRYTDDSYPQLLRAAGYRTGFVGKFGVRVERGRAAQMFDSFVPLRPPYDAAGNEVHLTDRTADAAIAFLEECDPEQPFCLSVSFNAPHAEDQNPRQYVWPRALDGLYAEDTLPLPATAAPEFFAALPELQRKSLNRVRWHWRFEPGKRDAMIRGYYRMITGVDRALGRILTALAELGREDDTVVIFTSDNGYFLGERGFAGKWTIHEPSIRVPLIVRDPRSDRKSAASNGIVLNVDLAPTILELAGVAVPPGYQGRSLVTQLDGKAERPDTWRDEFFYEHRFAHRDIPKCEGVRGTRWKYVRYHEQQPVHEELYDLANDPLEQHNRARDPAARAQLERLRARCDELRARFVGGRGR